jgi:peroxiredoxin
MMSPLSVDPAGSLTRRRLCKAALSASLLPLAGLSACARREAAPDFGYTLLDGTRGQSQALRGKVLLVNFWATTCAVCVKEMPQIVATHQRYRARGFDTLAVAMSHDPPALVAHFAESRRLPFGVAIDNTGAIARAWGDVRATPTTFVVDKRGAIARRWVGEPDFAALHGLIEQLLAEA